MSEDQCRVPLLCCLPGDRSAPTTNTSLPCSVTSPGKSSSPFFRQGKLWRRPAEWLVRCHTATKSKRKARVLACLGKSVLTWRRQKFPENALTQLSWFVLNPFLYRKLLARLCQVLWWRGEEGSVNLKKCLMWELGVSFIRGQNEDCSLGDSTSDSSEKLFQRQRDKASIHVTLVKGLFM